MSGVVLDASMAISWFLNDEHSEGLPALQNLVAAAGALVPRLWRLEMANAVLMAEKRNRIDRASADRIARAIGVMPVVEDDADVPIERLIDICRTHDLTSYDATYLELALRRMLPLASLDAKLARAARISGVDVLRAQA
jgi:predicted nucleic acid-binding protein